MKGSVPTNLPPALASIMNMGSNAPAQSAGMQSTGGLSSSMSMGQNSFLPQYEMGGMIGPGGQPEPMGVGVQQGMRPDAPMNPQMMEMQINQMATQHPEMVAQLRQSVMQAIQSGELTQQELNTVVQLATLTAQNPDMYPYVRKFALQQGLATEQDLPQQYDQGLIFILLLVARAVQEDMGGQNMMQGGTAAMAGMPSMASGGKVPPSKKADGGVVIEAHEGEYVIPKRVVEMKGKEFFDRMLEQYKDA